MKALLACLLLSLTVAANTAQARSYGQGELDALLAPVALQPDPILNHLLVAATYPDDVRDAAAWLRANAHLQGDDAVRAASSMLWHPSLKELLAYPELVERMGESPQWVEDLGEAYAEQPTRVMATVHALRQRAQANGYLNSDGYYSVERHGRSIAVQPVQSGVFFVRYYDPIVVFGPWWHAHRPPVWRPWHPRVHVHAHKPVHLRKPISVHRPVHTHTPVNLHNHVHQARHARPVVEGARIVVPERTHVKHHREHRHDRDFATPREHRRHHHRQRHHHRR